jgi:putative peptide zinc metalloprotease protein
LERQRPRAIAVLVGLLAAILVLLGVVPFPYHFRAPGILEARERAQVINLTAGNLARIAATPGSRVQAGQVLMELRNRQLELELAGALARAEEIQARQLQAMKEDIARLQPLQSLLEAASNRVQKLQADQAALVIRARQDGIWVAPEIKDYAGRWLARGTPLGLLVNPASFEFSATVQQKDVDALFARRIPKAQVRLGGQAGEVLPVSQWQVVPGGQLMLPSPALGWVGGGEMPVSPKDPQGRQTKEPFFEVRAQMPASAAVALLHGRSGKIRFDLDPEPLLPRWIRRLLQLLQQRYQV